jgi:hypothetical protein
MDPIKFNTFFTYFKNIFESINSELLDSGDIVTNFRFIFFKEYALYDKERRESYYISEDNTVDVLSLISEGMLTQESKNPIDIYLQTINFEFITNENYLDDLATIIRVFNLRYREVKDIIDSKTAIITSSKGVDKERTILHATKSYIFNFFVNITIFEELFISDDITVKINGVEVPVITLTDKRTTELVPDLVKTNDTVFFPNTTIQSINIIGYYNRNNVSINSLIRDIRSAYRFNQVWSLEIIEFSGTVDEDIVVSDSYFPSDAEITYTHGSIAAFKVTFYKSKVI